VRLDLTGPAGRLEALLEEPAEPRFAVLVLHPHPLHGGTMHNHATYQIARAARLAGGATLRFQFRGVGRSAGQHDGGPGELADARAALSWLGGRFPALPLFTSGMSFGAWIALQLGCAEAAVRGILAAGAASRAFALDFVRGCPKRVAVVQAERDEFGSPEEVGAFLEGPADRRRLAVLPGATHLFLEDLPGLQREATAAFGWLAEGLS
jgi:alpha/beta superfamily hydrolase